MDPDEGAAVGPQITIAPPPSILSKEDMAKLQKTYDRTLSMEEEEEDLEAEDEDKYNSEAPCGLQLSASGNHLVHPAVTVQHHNGGGGGGGGAGKMNWPPGSFLQVPSQSKHQSRRRHSWVYG